MFDTRRLKRLFWRFSIKLCGNSKQSCVVPGPHYTSSARWLLFVLRLIFIFIDRTFCILNYYYDKNYLINQQNLLVEREREKFSRLQLLNLHLLAVSEKVHTKVLFIERKLKGAMRWIKTLEGGQPTLNIQFRKAFYFGYFAAWFLSALRVLQSSTQMFTIPFEIDR